MEALII